MGPSDGGEALEDGALGQVGASWQGRVVERSLKAARAKAVSRSRQYLATAAELLQETGRADFTVHELVQRSRTSLRSFYQYFANKEELLLALLEETIAESVARWRAEIAGLDALDGLRVLVHRVYGTTGSDPWNRLNRVLACYHAGLAQQRPDAYVAAFAPLVEVLREVIERGAAEGVLRDDLPPERLTAVLVELVVGATLMSALGGPRFAGASDPEALWRFCRSGLVVPSAGT
ncbi:TetR/AcrR family transcriptional regulator [Actinocorallia sp. A-T 12471]|uniref:TetR/AcrR family transcriptional regulator n=1 Tax=Actinocorallia sp. A-T 12471 TaxID=3089813 RepID=UPI0029D17C93|nr:TetR/AcrR family transcriptional regulator [Actinocorallia sp. A-T 12471]MDX6740833.1 TetR/AcrR family transcriptional regulator [Actinocorallia sp. A-T 12471]